MVGTFFCATATGSGSLCHCGETFARRETPSSFYDDTYVEMISFFSSLLAADTTEEERDDGAGVGLPSASPARSPSARSPPPSPVVDQDSDRFAQCVASFHEALTARSGVPGLLEARQHYDRLVLLLQQSAGASSAAGSGGGAGAAAGGLPARPRRPGAAAAAMDGSEAGEGESEGGASLPRRGPLGAPPPRVAVDPRSEILAHLLARLREASDRCLLQLCEDCASSRVTPDTARQVWCACADLGDGASRLFSAVATRHFANFTRGTCARLAAVEEECLEEELKEKEAMAAAARGTGAFFPHRYLSAHLGALHVASLPPCAARALARGKLEIGTAWALARAQAAALEEEREGQ